MSPEEWAREISKLIDQAEDDGMRFSIEDGEFRLSGHPWTPGEYIPSVLVW